jgi:diguanylate cyclase (GGDEF)-like protein
VNHNLNACAPNWDRVFFAKCQSIYWVKGYIEIVGSEEELPRCLGGILVPDTRIGGNDRITAWQPSATLRFSPGPANSKGLAGLLFGRAFRLSIKAHMNNLFESVSSTTSGTGLLGASARWLAMHGKLWKSVVAYDSEQAQILECLAALGVGLEVWDKHGKPLLFNGWTAPAQHVNGPWKTPQTITTMGSAVSEFQSAARFDLEAPLLLELPSNRWNSVYKARSTAGYVAIARIDVTDMVRRNQYLENRVRELARDSATDALTGLANRRHFDEVYAVEWSRATRSKTPISLLMVDIDHFKKYNDHYGHYAGDRCLKRVATVLEGCVRRAGELVARYGGEEFVVLLPGVDQAEARETAEKCIERMAAECMPHAATLAADKRVSLSIGVASVQPHPALDSIAMLNAADAAMYRAKSGGRARYAVADHCDWNIADETPRTQPAAL